MSVAVLAQGLNKHGWLAQQGQVSDRVVLNYLLFARCVPQVCESDKFKILSKGATKALPFRRTHCSGPDGPSSVPVWTLFCLRESMFPAESQVISRKLFVKINGGPNFGS